MNSSNFASYFPAEGEASEEDNFKLSLFISGMTPRSTTAIANLKRICEEKLHGRYDLEIIDVYQQPTLARANQIIAVPTLIKRTPVPPRRLIGDMSSEDKVLEGLSIS